MLSDRKHMASRYFQHLPIPSFSNKARITDIPTPILRQTSDYNSSSHNAHWQIDKTNNNNTIDVKCW